MLNTQNTNQVISNIEAVNAFALFETHGNIVCPVLPQTWYVQKWSDPREVSHMLYDILQEKKPSDMTRARFFKEIVDRINHYELTHIEVTVDVLNQLIMGRRTGHERRWGLAALMYAVVYIVYGENLANFWNDRVG